MSVCAKWTNVSVASLLTLAVGAAHAADALSEKLQGHWLMKVEGEMRTYVLRIAGLKQDDATAIEHYAYFGPNGQRYPTPTDVRIARSAPHAMTAKLGTAQLEGRLEADNRIEGVVKSEFRTAKVRMTRESEDSIAKQVMSVPPVARNAKLEFLYLSTEDCVYCRLWEAGPKSAFLASDDGKQLAFVEVKGPTLKAPLVAQNYPADYKWAFEQIGPSMGVPRFVLAIDGKIVLNVYGVGTGGFSDLFVPGVREVVKRRNGAS